MFVGFGDSLRGIRESVQKLIALQTFPPTETVQTAIFLFLYLFTHFFLLSFLFFLFFFG
jgi:hypothetical protein